jgi:hypothetical protein
MKRAQGIVIVSTIAFSLACVVMASSPAYAGPNVPQGHYCLSYDTGGADCSFTSYAQCLAMASGIDAECYGKTIHDDDADRHESARPHVRRRPLADARP